MKKIILGMSLFLLCCGKDQVDCTFEGKNCRTEKPTPEEMVTEEQRAALRQMKSNTYSWVLRCEGGIACGEDDNKKPDAGDSMLWAGLLCSSGEKDQCIATKASQGPQGQLFRNPEGSRGKNDSSRDMLLGFLTYLGKTKDQPAAVALLKYLQANNYKLCENATDNRCLVNPTVHSAVWGTMKRVWSHIGLSPSPEMNQGDLTDDSIINLESKFAAEGYELHLVAVELLLRQNTNNYSETLQRAANNILERQPYNPFFEYVAKGATARAAQLVLDKCPTTQSSVRKQWAWQRAEAEQAWLLSKGWDCIYMSNLLLK
jgi:hypothetical protein